MPPILDLTPNLTASLPLSQPSTWWCTWKNLRGAQWTHLTIPPADMRGKWVLLTGANNGIGREAALQFARWGANIVLACRDPAPKHETQPDVAVAECLEAAREAGHEDTKAEWWAVDMASVDSVLALGKRWRDSGRPLDVLCNNAGMAQTMGEPPPPTVDGFGLVHQVNFLSHVLVTLGLLPALARASSASPRVVCTTSSMQFAGVFDLRNANATDDAYPNNKLYFQTWLTELQRRMDASDRYRHVLIHGVHPGMVRTGLWKAITNQIGKPWFETALNGFLNWFGIDAQQGSLAITNAATAIECGPPGFGGGRGKGGARYMNRIWDEEPMPQTRNPECGRRIWEFVGLELGLKEKGLLDGLEDV